ncbi:hypothetical protein [Nocardia sp. A7]|uniref:hypothetical protein n=1 Tax=Nocardia sp. A7 TaxID=2789274 RepID=UPI00397C9DA8
MLANRIHLHRLLVVAVVGVTAALGACSADNPDDTDPTATASDTQTTPTGLRWQPFQGIALPVTDQGPHRIDAAVASGFDRSPVGAALAATQASVRISVANDGQWPRIGAAMLAAGPRRDAWAVARARISITAPITDGGPKLLGYHITRYNPDATDVDLYALHPDNSVTRHHTAVLWQHEDWRLVLPDTNPAAAPAVTAVALTPPELVAFEPR